MTERKLEKLSDLLSEEEQREVESGSRAHGRHAASRGC